MVFCIVVAVMIGAIAKIGAFKSGLYSYGKGHPALSKIHTELCNRAKFFSHRTLATSSDVGAKSYAGMKRTKRILSGVQPTGSLHIGNYLGAIKQWVAFQENYDSYFCVVDLHAITVPQNPKQLRKDTLQTAAMYIAAGIDPQKSNIFIQSHVHQHSELAWLLNCITPMSWLERMIQFKEKSVKQGENVSVGLFGYPLLMASDILLYQPDLVPVGEDQRQHLELTRDVARRFNRLYASEENPVFVDPQPLILQEGARIMSLQDGTSKMSKSAESDGSRINLLDKPDIIAHKIKRCKTDAIKGIEWNNKDRPEATNLLNILFAVSIKSKEELLREVQDMNWGQFKNFLTEALISHLTPIQQRYEQTMKDPGYLEEILRKGEENAVKVAEETLIKAKQAIGLHVKK